MVFDKGDFLRWIYGRIFGKPMNFSFIDEFVAASATPMQKKEVDWLREKNGIGAILSIREDPLAAGWIEGLDYLDVPVRNHFPPTLEQLKGSVDFIVNETRERKKIDVHCAAGKGRTGTVLAAYLCYAYGLSAEEAIKQVRAKREGSIEKKQEPVIYEYSNQLKSSVTK